ASIRRTGCQASASPIGETGTASRDRECRERLPEACSPSPTVSAMKEKRATECATAWALSGPATGRFSRPAAGRTDSWSSRWLRPAQSHWGRRCREATSTASPLTYFLGGSAEAVGQTGFGQRRFDVWSAEKRETPRWRKDCTGT